MIVPDSPIGGTDVADHYDRLNDFYCDVWGSHRHHGFWDKGWETSSEAIILMARKIALAAKVGPNKRVVDVGCGTGGIAWHFAQESGAEVVGYTVSLEEKKTAEEREVDAGAAVPRFVCSDWLDNDLPDEWADAVVLIESFSHMVDRAAVLAEVERVLKPGGRLVIADWAASENPSWWQIKGLLQPICRGGQLTGLSTFDENEELFKETCLQTLEITDITESVSKTWQKITARLMGKVACENYYRKFMWQCLIKNRDLIFAIPRVMSAYALGCLRYEWMVAEKGSCTLPRNEGKVRP